MIEEPEKIEVLVDIFRFESDVVNDDSGTLDADRCFDFVAEHGNHRILSHSKILGFFSRRYAVASSDSIKAVVWEGIASGRLVALGGMILRKNKEDESKIENGASFVVVSSRFRGKKLGKMLIERQMRYLKERGICQYWATVGASNIPSVKLMESMGMNEIRRYNRELDGREIIMYERRFEV